MLNQIKLMFRHDFIDWTGWVVSNHNMVINKRGQVVYKDDLNSEGQSVSSQKEDSPSTASQVELTWEQRKQKERDGNKTVLSGVPNSLPSLIKAYRIQDKARNVGFDWKKKEDIWKKVDEELNELKIELAKGDKEKSTKELGDFLFLLSMQPDCISSILIMHSNIQIRNSFHGSITLNNKQRKLVKT